LEDVLGYSTSAFLELLDDEQRGGVGITGHTLIPEGAIYLTWYQKGSTRVFRNMRFLISPIAVCDLIIGAHSIIENNLLEIPKVLQSGLAK
jgi:hypothetical protein